jgi:hypothetical protein
VKADTFDPIFYMDPLHNVHNSYYSGTKIIENCNTHMIYLNLGTKKLVDWVLTDLYYKRRYLWSRGLWQNRANLRLCEASFSFFWVCHHWIKICAFQDLSLLREEDLTSRITQHKRKCMFRMMKKSHISLSHSWRIYLRNKAMQLFHII